MRERTPFSADLIRSLPDLKLLLVTGTQFQCFELDTLKELNIPVAASKGQGRTDRPDKSSSSRNIIKANAHSTTQHAWALILGLARNIAQDDFVVKTGVGSRVLQQTYWEGNWIVGGVSVPRQRG
ncbi:hypothetical protein FKW77_008940 [Venturia effusa]|uniref:D-isomer specific 2-hydroxyacid dehydrogenase catalytic domain-containing protein n=1 Tax=Venturia effusa TaxID=50376 RepID=A0A517KX40_9PEZI|nr:hypothetical protein FKW77_008940 [Venturia effusa]